MATTASEEFLTSEDAWHLPSTYQRVEPKTVFMIAPLLLVSERIRFEQTTVRNWLSNNRLFSAWIPTMRGVTSSLDYEPNGRHDVELNRNGALISCHYTRIASFDPKHIIAYSIEFEEILKILEFAKEYCSLQSYVGPLLIKLTITCPQGSNLRLPRTGRPRASLEPVGTNLRISTERGASELISHPHGVLRHLADEIFRSFGVWEADCFDENDELVDVQRLF